MWTVAFWRATAERAIRTFAQSFAAVIVVGATGVIDADWLNALSVSGLTTLLSILTSLAAGASSPASGPSLGTEVPRDDVAAQVAPGSPHGEELVAGAAAEDAAGIPEGADVAVVPDPKPLRDARGRYARREPPAV